jgi:hypothetical protein
MMAAKTFLFGLILLLTAATPVHADNENSNLIEGGGTSLVTGGTGSPDFVPVMTNFGFHWRNGKGKFECLALVPGAKAGTPGSGNFDTNAMYVTGTITSAEIHGQRATMSGIATVTGLGAGTHVPFSATAESGGPGTRLVLTVSGLVFDEIIIQGSIKF